MSTTRRPSFTTAERMAHRVHRGSANVRTSTHPAFSPGLSQDDVHVLRIGDDANRGSAVRTDTSHFTRRKCDLRPILFSGSENAATASTPAQLATAARLEFDVMDSHPQGNLAQRHAVTDARLDVLGTTHYLIASLEPFGSEDVTLLAIDVLDKGDAGSTVRVILDRDDRGLNVIFRPLEVD